MNRKEFAGIVLTLALLLALQAGTSCAQGMGYGMGYGMGWYDKQITIPDKLPKPQNEKWVSKLREILAKEKLSKVQYEADSAKYQIYMPYMMVVPQEENHIAWINKMFAAYGLATKTNALPVKETKKLTEAYKNAMQLELNLARQYEWLIKNSPDATATKVLETILLQTRMHYTMFDHASRMTGLRGKGIRGGYGMGYGMMRGYGMGQGMGYGMMGPGYGRGPGYMRSGTACSKYYNETTQQRKTLLDKQFEYSEAQRNPKTTIEQLDKMEKEILDLQESMYKKAPAGCRW